MIEQKKNPTSATQKITRQIAILEQAQQRHNRDKYNQREI
jgi:hypothetical protein